MVDRPGKRVRRSSNSYSTIDHARLAKFPKLIETLNEKTVRKYLLVAARESSQIARLIETETDRLRRLESAKTIDFGYHSKSVWRTLNVEYVKGIKHSRQYHLAGDAYLSVSSEIQDIGNRCPAHASYVTKYSALETLRKIGKIILFSNDSTLGHEVQNSFFEDTVLEDTMLGIVEGMTTEERGDMIREPQEEMVWIDKLKELQAIAAEHSMFEKLKDVIYTLEDKHGRTHRRIDMPKIVDLVNDDAGEEWEEDEHTL